jgi:hypothetical protein
MSLCLENDIHNSSRTTHPLLPEADMQFESDDLEAEQLHPVKPPRIRYRYRIELNCGGAGLYVAVHNVETGFPIRRRRLR